MSLASILEDFGKQTDGGPLGLTDVMIEEQKLTAFENGYQAGWDDSAKSSQDAGTQISEDFAQNIRDLSFTYHDAYAAFLADLKPMLQQMVETVLPTMAHETLGPKLVELIEAEITASGPTPVMLTVAPDNYAILLNVMNEAGGDLSVDLVQDDTLVPGQVCLRFGEHHEQELDIATLLTGIRTAIDGFFQMSETNFKETA